MEEEDGRGGPWDGDDGVAGRNAWIGVERRDRAAARRRRWTPCGGSGRDMRFCCCWEGGRRRLSCSGPGMAEKAGAKKQVDEGQAVGRSKWLWRGQNKRKVCGFCWGITYR